MCAFSLGSAGNESKPGKYYMIKDSSDIRIRVRGWLGITEDTKMATEIKRLRIPAGEENYLSPWTHSGVGEGEEESQGWKGDEGTLTSMLDLRLGELEEQYHNMMPEETRRIFATL